MSASAARFFASNWGGEVPVDLHRLAALAGFQVCLEPLPENIGCRTEVTKPSYGKVYPVFKVNANSSPTRQRYALAHALAHAALGHMAGHPAWVDEVSHYGSYHSDPQERMANDIALKWLVPSKPFHLLLRHGKKETTTLEALARTFGVSHTAMTIRVEQLHKLFPR